MKQVAFIFLVVAILACESNTTVTPTATKGVKFSSGNTGIRRIVLVPVDENGNALANYTKQAGDCLIEVRIDEGTQGINIYPSISQSHNEYAIGYLLATDGVVIAERLMWGPTNRYRWAWITACNISGWVHADPPWTMAAPPCEAEEYINEK